MIVCHCRAISDRDIHAALDWMRAADPDTVITPGRVYRALGTTPDCGGCLPLFLATMRRNPNLCAGFAAAPASLHTDVPDALRDLRDIIGKE
ncbi:(2Fe-2S)-binding protein [Rhodobacteraceae bacterium 2CG4]|uniref:(2Fe-2S)-binding protein n=1 Tax=Halovulum marinum TaxID=2662447 RepID=A0A6L5YW15_9RHOB|nr:(2Fe-2S)-binding protein [Halovulum marinum]MSU88005.1 (2Fe-2S)-binding protein [Halovulum marinum]